MQSQLRNRGVTALAGGELAEALALTDRQKTELREKLAKLTGAEVKPKPIALPAIRQFAPKVKSGE